jgi:hypothetical protein
MVAGGAGGIEFVSAGSGAIAVACVRSFRGVGLGVAGAFLDRAGGVWGCAGGVWELYGCRRVAYVRVRVWGLLVLWKGVPYLRVGDGGIFCGVWGVVVVWCGVGRGIFEHSQGERGCS